jgi:O-antigen/teichoic acid export membrane protein
MSDEESIPQADDAGGADGDDASLTSKVIKGAGWVFAGKMVGRGLSLLRMVVLANLLDPKDFGLFGIVMLAIAALSRFTSTGFNVALVQRQENTEEYLDTAWTVQVVRAFLLALLLYVAAPWLALFFEEPRVVPLLRVMCIGVAVMGLSNIGMIYLGKELQFHKSFAYESLAGAISLAVGIVLAYTMRSVWALIWSGLAGRVAMVVMSYMFHPYRPRFEFKWERFKPLFHFGKFVLLQTILVFLCTQGDDAFVGKYLTAQALGLYQMAYRLSNMAATQIAHVVGRVTFPAYAKIQDQPERLAAALRRTFRLVSAAVLPVSLGLLAVAPEVIEVVLGGGKWRAMTPSLQVLCIYGLTRALTASFAPIYRARARMDITVWFQLLRLLVMAAAIYPMSRSWGVTGASIAVTLSGPVVLFLSVRALSKLLGCSRWSLVKPAIAPVWSCMLMLGAVFSVKRLLPVNWSGLIGMIAVGALVYGVSLVATSAEMREIAQKQWRRLTGRKNHTRGGPDAT